jgi:hypothetical protein
MELLNILGSYVALAFFFWIAWFLISSKFMNKIYKKYEPGGTFLYWTYNIILYLMVTIILTGALWLVAYTANPFPFKSTPLYRLFFN